MTRILYRDLIPYETPSSLSALHGPSEGMLELPITVHWGPRKVFDLGSAPEQRAAYRAHVREGTPEVQEELLNEELLRQVWVELSLPSRCRQAWEDRFPDLAT